MIRADNLSGSKKSSVSIYYKEFLAVPLVEVKDLNECVILCALRTKEDMWSKSIDHLVKHRMSLTFF